MLLRLAEARVDYMSSCILLGRASQLTVSLRDLWEGLQLAGKKEEVGEAKIQVLAELSWERVQLAIHRTTTKSMMNIVQKIQDFFLQQKRRSERTISIMLPADTKASKVLAAYREKEKKAEQKKDSENGKLLSSWQCERVPCGCVAVSLTPPHCSGLAPPLAVGHSGRQRGAHENFGHSSTC